MLFYSSVLIFGQDPIMECYSTLIIVNLNSIFTVNNIYLFSNIAERDTVII
jgi:hypothetical protein